MRIPVYVAVAWLAIAVEAGAQSSPYSVWRHVVAVGATGKKLESDEFRGRRPNGDTVETFTGLRRRLHSESHGIEVDIDDTLKITTTMGSGSGETPLDRRDCREGGDPEKPVRPEDVKVILGFKVIRVMSANAIMQDERWQAPDLNCEELERMVHFFENGQPDGYTLYTATKAVAAAPDENMYAVPDGALEMPTSRYLWFVGKSPTRAHDQKVQAMADATYARQLAQRQAAGVTLDVFKRTGP